MQLYVVEHKDGSGPMSIPLPWDEACEFAHECNLPYIIKPTLQRTIELFTKVNEDCAESDESVVPFASDPDIVAYYMHQMDNLDIFSESEMEEFKSFLMSQPHAPMISFGENP